MLSTEVFFNKIQSSIINYLPKIFFAIIIFFSIYFLAKFFRTASLNFYKKVFKRQQSDFAKIISVTIYFLLLLFGTFLALDILGLGGVLSKILTGAGIIGIIAGFAFKDIVSNIFAGILLNVQKPFKEGDWVEIENNYGTVYEIGWITTSIKTTTGQEVFVPNQLIYNNIFTNYSTFNKRLVVFRTGVAYGDNLDVVKKSALDEIKKVDGILKNEPIDFYFTGIASSSYDFELRCWIKFEKEIDYKKTLSEVIMRIKRRFEKENISLAYSVTTLDFGVKGGVNLFDKPIQIENKR